MKHNNHKFKVPYDITEESINKYLKLEEFTDNIILFIDMEGRIVDANNAAIKAYGYSYEELISINIADIRADWVYTEEQMKLAINAGILFKAKHRRKDGSCFDVEVSFLGCAMNNKHILASIVRDIADRNSAEEKLKAEKELFRTVFEQSPIGMAFCKANGEIIDANPMHAEILGRSVTELKRLGWKYITLPEDINENLKRYKECITKADSTTKRYIKPDGSIVWGNLTIASLSFENRSKQIYLCMLEDITERIEAEEKLHESERTRAMILSNLPGMAYRCNIDREWTMQFVSDGCYELTGYKPEDLVGNKELSFNELIDPEFREYVRIKWEEAIILGDVFREEYSITTAMGDVKWVYEQGRCVYGENGRAIALEGLIIDITERKKKEDEINYLNYYDVLTDLYNRRFFVKRLIELDEKSCLPLSVIIGDINGLKLINDAFGHAQGDRLIVAIARIIKDCIRKNDIAARTGGDDFSILLLETDDIEAYEIMDRIESACNEYISKSNDAMFITNISLGCATKISEKEPIEDIIKSAEDRMYLNKLLQNKSLHNSVISSIKTTLLEKSQETEEHALRLIKLSTSIGRKMKLTVEQLNELELLSTLHDIGKIGVSDNVINKPGKLTCEERVLMNKHPEIGYRIAMASHELLPIANYILCHHERYDGNGYPQGLKGEEIPLLARIISVVDAYDAMTEDRSYRKAMTMENAIREIKRNAGTQFDPEIVKIFIDTVSEAIDL